MDGHIYTFADVFRVFDVQLPARRKLVGLLRKATGSFVVPLNHGLESFKGTYAVLECADRTRCGIIIRDFNPSQDGETVRVQFSVSRPVHRLGF